MKPAAALAVLAAEPEEGAKLLASLDPTAAIDVVAAEPQLGAGLLLSLDSEAAAAILAAKPAEGSKLLAAMTPADAARLLSPGRVSDVQAIWDPPWPYGFPSAVDSAATIVSPLFAGFSFALIGLIVQDPTALRWPGIALALLMLAGMSFIAAVQCGFWARQWVTTPSEIADWRPTDSVDERSDDQHMHRNGFKLWARRLSFTYRLGISTLLLGVTLTLVPGGQIGALRILAVATAGLAFILELAWIASGWILRGSPIALYPGQPDVPKPGTKALWIRDLAPLRSFARRFRPLSRPN
jgi:hypothetical protein